MDMTVSSMSGGEKAKLALARQLVGLAGVDVMFLDEPTNHLDIQTTEWLEAFLKDFQGAQLIVSHDRYFLDQVCTRIIEVDNLRAWPWKGNYSQFMKQKIATEASLGDRIKTVEKKIQATMGALKQMKRANKYDKSISAKHKMIERMQQELKALKARVPKKRKPLILTLEATDKASMDVLHIEGGSKRFEGLERPILDNQDLEIRKGDRIGIVGGNGQGKTTLLKMINGDLKLDSGTRDLAPGCQIGYFHQDHATLDFNLNPVEQIEVLRPDFQYGDIRAALGRFQFSSDQVKSKLSQLSGGERARVALLKLLLEENNLLLMDEPTNHLDMDSKDTLEEALIGYEGSLVTVSHDRWFLDQVVNRIWELQDGVITTYYGNYTDYVRAKKGLPPLGEDEISEV
jgi:ATP-binding cassette subfamily F protein 3